MLNKKMNRKDFVKKLGIATVALPLVSSMVDAKTLFYGDNAKLSDLSTDGFVKTINSDGTFSVDTNTYLTDAPSDGTTYGRKDGDWEEISTPSVTRILKATLYNPTLDTTIIPGTTSYYRIPFDCTITGWYLTETSETPVDSTVVINLWKDSTANYPPTSADAITPGFNPIKLESEKINSDTSLSGWTTTLNSGDYLAIYVTSNDVAKRLELQIEVST